MSTKVLSHAVASKRHLFGLSDVKKKIISENFFVSAAVNVSRQRGTPAVASNAISLISF